MLGYAPPDPNFTYDDFVAMIERQGGSCLCGKPATHIDHCHITGRVRFITCSNCNTGIGMLQNSPTLMRMYADALEAM